MAIELPNKTDYQALIELARREDLGGGDITSNATIPARQQGTGQIVFRQPGILCGMPVVQEALRQYDEHLELRQTRQDGEHINANTVIAKINGPLRSLLAAERVLLNFLQRLSGIATMTARYVEQTEGAHAQILDTRKTTPGWRELEKYAVCCGGGTNHRQGLYDAILIKDNHLQALGPGDLKEKLTQTVETIFQRYQELKFIEVEVDDLQQLQTVLGVQGVDIILLDNMNTDQLSQAVALRDRMCPSKKVLLEASGNVILEKVNEIARTGVDRISVGALTHSAIALDIGLDLSS
ncbi:MAG: carboxylating nicotinate-nucleotide diphosphorylase [Planctomycetes bacterium]|nr:carboxylating nicotinate-nucleotide diphosphorylase [Planctomycetota bacterium]